MENVTRSQGVPHEHEADAPLITLRLSLDEGRWLVTAVAIAQRLLEGLHLRGCEAQDYQLRGLAALHRSLTNCQAD